MLFRSPEWDGYLVIELLSEEGAGTYYIDTEEGSSDLFIIALDAALVGDGVYTVDSDFTGSIQFPTNDIFDIVGGTITISGDEWTFDLQISDGAATGSFTGTKTYMFLDDSEW